MSINNEIVELVNKVIINLDPTPIITNSDFPLRWETNIYIDDYDFADNYLELNQNFEKSTGMYLKSVATAIEVNKHDDGSFEFWDGVYMIESHTWCSMLNKNKQYPSFSLINKKFNSIKELKEFIFNLY
jgi:hypothetical protein